VLDQAVPLWLRGWKSGRNSLQLELLDGSGAALNAPFNSFVRAIELAAPGSEQAAAKPRWQQGRLSGDELAILLGEQPPSPPEPTEAPEQESPLATSAQSEIAPVVDPRQQPEGLEQALAQGEPDDRNEPTTQQPASPEGSTSQEQAAPSPEQQDTSEQQQLNEAEVSSEPTSADTAASPAESEQQEANQPLAPPAEKREGQGEPESEPQSEPQSELQAEPLSEPKTEAAAELEPNPRDQHNPETQLAISGLVESSGRVNVVPGSEGPSQDTSGLELSATEPEASEASSPALPLQIAPPERISSSTPLGGSARDQVNPDGSLIQPTPNGPLAGLRHLLGGS